MIWFPPASVLAVRFGPVTHVGLASDRLHNWEPTVISSSFKRGCVIEEPLSAFAEGKKVELVGYPGCLHPHEVLRRARAELGRPWRLFDNCEHFVHRAHGLEPRSPQLATAMLLVLAVGGIYLTVRKQASQ